MSRPGSAGVSGVPSAALSQSLTPNSLKHTPEVGNMKFHCCPTLGMQRFFWRGFDEILSWWCPLFSTESFPVEPVLNMTNLIFSTRSRNHGHECANIYYHSWPDNTPNFDGFTRQDGDFPWRFVSLPEGSYRHLLRAAVLCWYLARVPPHIAIRQNPNNLCMYIQMQVLQKWCRWILEKRHNISKYVDMHRNWNSFWILEFIPHSPINVKTFAIALAATCQLLGEHRIFGWSTPHQGARANIGQNGQRTAVHHQFGEFVIKNRCGVCKWGCRIVYLDIKSYTQPYIWYLLHILINSAVGILFCICVWNMCVHQHGNRWQTTWTGTL